MFKNNSNNRDMGINDEALGEVFSTFTSNTSDRGDRVKLSRREKKAVMKQLKHDEANAKREASRQASKYRQTVAEQLKDREIELSKKYAKQRKARRGAKDVVDFIGYNTMFENGICEVEDGLYSETIEFDDVSYQSAREDAQKEKFSVMCQLYDSFGADNIVQFTVFNKPLSQEHLDNRQFFSVKNQENAKCAEFANVYNNILEEKLKEGVSNMERHRYITYSVGADNLAEATQRLARLRNDVIGNFVSMKSNAWKLDGTERLELIHSLLRPHKNFLFDYEKDIRLGVETTTKDCIAPMTLDFNCQGSATYFKSEDMYCQVLVMNDLGSEVNDRVISDIADMDIPLCCTWFCQGTDKGASTELVARNLTWINSDIIKEQKNAIKDGFSGEILPIELENAKNDTEELLDLIRNQNQRLFWFTGLVYTYAPTVEQLQQQTLAIMRKARRNGVQLKELAYRQREGLNSVLPIGHNHVDIDRSMLTMQVGMLTPFATTEIDDGDGSIWVAQNKESMNLIMHNRKKLSSPMGFISGKPGSGKSFFVKNEIQQTILSSPEDQIIIIDPSNEYSLLVKENGGQNVKFKVGGGARLNPFDLGDTKKVSYEETISFKTEAILAGASASAVVTNSNLNELETSFITRAVRMTYEQIRDRSPLMQDFVEILKHAGDGDENLTAKAIELAARYSRYIDPPYDFFNAPTNVSFDNRIMNISLKDLPESMLPFGLINIFETVRNKMYENDSKGVRTWVYVDEIQSMMKFDPVIEYMSRYVREGRKFGLLFTGITQAAISLLENPKARDIVSNADYYAIMKQDPIDRAQWADLLSLSKIEEDYIGDTIKAGDGLLISGGRHVPFSGNFPKGNVLYDLFDTDPNAELTTTQKNS